MSGWTDYTDNELVIMGKELCKAFLPYYELKTKNEIEDVKTSIKQELKLRNFLHDAR